MRRLAGVAARGVEEGLAQLITGARGELAERALEAALALRPGRARVHLGLANCARLRQDFDRAERELRTALALEPGSPTALYNLSFTLAQRAERAGTQAEKRALYGDALSLLDTLLGQLAASDPRRAPFAESRANLARQLQAAGG